MFYYYSCKYTEGANKGDYLFYGRPKYKTRTGISGENKQVFENIDEASRYWKRVVGDRGDW